MLNGSFRIFATDSVTESLDIVPLEECPSDLGKDLRPFAPEEACTEEGTLGTQDTRSSSTTGQAGMQSRKHTNAPRPKGRKPKPPPKNQPTILRAFMKKRTHTSA